MNDPIDLVAADKVGPDRPLGLAQAPSLAFGWTALAMLLLALIAYLPAALGAEFVAFDDNLFFGPDNPEFRAGFATVFDPSRPIANAYLPVAHASLWLDWWWFAGTPLGPHLVSLVLHAAVAVAFVRLLGRLRVASFPAHFAGALFVLHPAMAESVSWVSGRKDLLAALFVFLALLATARFAQAGGRWRVALAMLWAALAMYSKATAVVLPGLAFLVCLVSGGTRVRFAVPVLLLAVVLPIAAHHQSIAAAEGTMADSAMLGGGLASRLLQAPGAFAHYLGTTLWPTGLNVLYPEVQTLERFRAALWPGIAAIGGILGLAIAASFGRPTHRRIGFGLLAFVVALLPFNTAWPASSIAAADRYLHLAVPGMALAIVLAATALLGRLGIALFALALLPLALLAGKRAHEFRTTESLWRSSLAADADNAVAHFNLAAELMGRTPLRVEEVESHLRAAIAAARYPIHAMRARRILLALASARADYEAAAGHARAAIAAAASQRDRERDPGRRAQAEELVAMAHVEAFEPLRRAGDDVGARESHRQAVARLPEHPEVIAFAALLALAGVADELRAQPASTGSVLPPDDPRGLAADRDLAAALAANPDHPALVFAQASWDRVRGNVLSALRNYQLVQKVAPERVEAWQEAARLMRERGYYDAAARYATGGLRHRDDPTLRQEWALALIGAGRLDDAILQLEAYLAARPGDVDTGKILANVLIGRAYARLSESSGAHEEALRIVERALAYNPNESKAHLVLGRVARERRQFAKAVQHLETAHALLPDFVDATTMLADSLRDLGMERLLAKDYIGAGDAWLRFVEVAPAEIDTAGVKLQLAGLWRRHESRGVELMTAKDRDGAIAEFRRCLRLDPEQRWISWLLAMAIYEQPDVDLEELERLCREAVAWQDQHGLDSGQQVYLLSKTLLRRDRAVMAREVAAGWLARSGEGAEPKVVAALRAIVDGR